MRTNPSPLPHVLVMLGLLVWCGSLVAASAPAVPATPDVAAMGFDPVRLQRLDAVIQDNVDRKQIAGGIMFIARDGKTVHQRTYGMQDIEAARPMAPDAIFRIA